VDERWIYARSYGSALTNVPETSGRSAPIVFEDVEEPAEHEDGTLVIPKRMKYVIALAIAMEREAIATLIAGPQAAASGLGYSRMAFTAGTLAEFIRGLGYHAIPCGNNTALSIPIAIGVGLVELGRNGLLITLKYGEVRRKYSDCRRGDSTCVVHRCSPLSFLCLKWHFSVRCVFCFIADIRRHCCTGCCTAFACTPHIPQCDSPDLRNLVEASPS
jgi:hypothetical protein